MLEVVYCSGMYYFHNSATKSIEKFNKKGKDCGEFTVYHGREKLEVRDFLKYTDQVLKVSQDQSAIAILFSKIEIVHIRLGEESCYKVANIAPDSYYSFGKESDPYYHPDYGKVHIDSFVLVGAGLMVTVTNKGEVCLWENEGYYDPDVVFPEWYCNMSGHGMVDIKPEGENGEKEDSFYLAANDTEQTVALLAKFKSSDLASRIMVFEIKSKSDRSSHTLVLKASIDLKSRGLRCYNSICFIPRINCYDFICGYSSIPQPTLFIYSYDIYAQEIKLEREIKISTKGDGSINRLERFRGMVYGFMKNGRILKVQFDC